jgi:ABC-2 type transport system permease protein
MSTTTYARLELLRCVRNRRFLVFSLGFPLALFLLVAAPNREENLDGIPFPTYYMAGMVAWGTMLAVLASGARISAERAVGWNRQLRITPLPPRTYIEAKVLTGYLTAGLSIAALYVAGSTLGVRLTAVHWVEMTVLILIGLVPFAVLGILLGHLVTVDSIGPALGGVSALFALLGGAWGPLTTTGWMHSLAMLLPSYWLVQAAKTGYRGHAWPTAAWLVITIWTLTLAVITTRVYRRDTTQR